MNIQRDKRHPFTFMWENFMLGFKNGYFIAMTALAEVHVIYARILYVETKNIKTKLLSLKNIVNKKTSEIRKQ